MATKIVRRDIRPHRAANGRLLGYYEDTYFVGDRPPTTRPQKQLRTTQKTTPARPPTPSPLAFLSKTGRVITLTHCCKCDKTHQACECWPPCSARQIAAEAAAAAVPRVREQTFAAVVRRQQEQGLRPGGPTTTTPPDQPETTLQAVVRLQKERGLR